MKVKKFSKLKLSVLAAALVLSPQVFAINYLFVSNNTDNNYAIMAQTYTPRFTGSNRWAANLKGTQQVALGYTSTFSTQYSSGKFAGGYGMAFLNGWVGTMRLIQPSISQPFQGITCFITETTGCPYGDSFFSGEVRSDGIYNVVNQWEGDSTDARYPSMLASLSDNFYQYIANQAVGASTTIEIEYCQVKPEYNTGTDCASQTVSGTTVTTTNITNAQALNPTSSWSKVLRTHSTSHTKIGQMTLKPQNKLTEVYVGADGGIVLADDNLCTYHKNGIGTISTEGIMCKLVDVEMNVTSIASSWNMYVYPILSDPALAASATNNVWFSLNGNTWSRYSSNPSSSYSTYASRITAGSSTGFYMYYSKDFFINMINSNDGDVDTQGILSFAINNPDLDRSGYYEFSPSNQLVIKPRDFGISIREKNYNSNPHVEGMVGQEEPPLEIDYVITTINPIDLAQADKVTVQVTGPSGLAWGRTYCIFTDTNNTSDVPVPGLLQYTRNDGIAIQHNHGCAGSPFNITDALWDVKPVVDTGGFESNMYATDLKLIFPMNDSASLQNTKGEEWFGSVSATGKVRVEATWSDVD